MSLTEEQIDMEGTTFTKRLERIIEWNQQKKAEDARPSYQNYNHHVLFLRTTMMIIKTKHHNDDN